MSTTALPTGPDIQPEPAQCDCPPGCLACGAELLGPYCHKCGQKNDDCRRSIFRLMAETATDVLALDGRFARTCREIITKPGRHIRDYAHGKRSPFTPPVRLFLLVSLLFFTTLQLTGRHILVLDVELRERGEVVEGAREGMDEVTRGLIEGFTEESHDTVPIEAGNQTSLGATRNAVEAVQESEEEGFVPIPHLMFFEKAPDRTYTEEEQVYLRQMIDLDKLEINRREVSSDRLADSVISIVQNPTSFNRALNEWIPTLMVLFIPFMALLGTVVIRGRDALVYDHLLVSIQTHAVAFLVVSLSIATAGFMPAGAAALAFFVGVPFYYYRATRGAFRRSRRKTLTATLFVFAIYSTCFWAGILFAGINSLIEVL